MGIFISKPTEKYLETLHPNYGQLVGTGGYGDIYRCVENPSIAVKVVMSNTEDTGEDNKKIVQVCSQVKAHPNVMQLYGGRHEGALSYIFFEYLPGQDLYKYLEKNGPITDDRQISDFMVQLLSGLSYLHTHDIIHRDIKPENIQISKGNRLKIMDFGLATSETPSQALVGTTGYIAPEIIEQKQPYDQKCDIWSAGIVLYEIVTGREPFSDAHTLTKYSKKLLERREVDYRDQEWNQFPILEKICRQMIEYDPVHRLDSQRGIAVIVTRA